MDILDRQKYIFGALFLLANKMQVMGDQYLGKQGMTTKQWLLTMMISQFGEYSPTLSEVSDMMGSSRQNVKQLAIKLQEKEFIKLERDQEDGRVLRLLLTAKCYEFWAKREEQDNLFIRKLFEAIGEEDLDAISRSFDKLFARLEQGMHM